MSGHSKWANIKNKKAKTDAARGKIFTKIGKEIAVAAKGGADPALNSKLADVIAKAKAANMPNDNIARAIKKAAGEGNSVNYETLVYEGYGVGGSAVIVQTLTDNKNRTVGDVRHYFDKYGGSLGSTGSVSYMFEQKGVIVAERTVDLDEDTMMEIALEAGADDVLTDDDCYTVYTAPGDFSAVRKFLESKGITFIEADVEMVPNDYITLEEKQLETFMKMLDALEDNDDVQAIYHNVNLPEDEEEE
ncbi:MAG: YebC/PmpR family DNA-binding transcriptional regulator [Clostridia bacterium]|nr:YebC/PmpR family DNA-binding transcriptional regulator [Clostridia bacterium]